MFFFPPHWVLCNLFEGKTALPGTHQLLDSPGGHVYEYNLLIEVSPNHQQDVAKNSARKAKQWDTSFNPL